MTEEKACRSLEGFFHFLCLWQQAVNAPEMKKARPDLRQDRLFLLSG